jgi:uncharacterized membrane protein YphA (DoxX/SURF4 family)
MNFMEKYLFHSVRIIAALILIQTLFFKFSGATESIYIFSTLGVEPWGRYFAGVFELIASICLLIPAYVWLGALLALATMFGAILSHLLILGIVVHDDSGLLFGLAVCVFIASFYLLFRERNKNSILKLIFKKLSVWR